MEITLNIQFNKAMIKLEHPHETKKKKLNDPTSRAKKIKLLGLSFLKFHMGRR